MGQKVEFKRNFGPNLGEFQIDNFLNVDEKYFFNRLSPIYKLLENLKKAKIVNKDLIGFVGAPWTLLVYIVTRSHLKRFI